MKTVIIYASKHGCTEKCSNILKGKLHGEVKIVDIKKESMPEMILFDNIIIGGSIYMGRIQKEVNSFCLKNISALKKKKLGFFICCMSENEMAEKQIHTSFPEELLTDAIATQYFGGEFIFKKMNVLERFIIKKISKTNKDTSTLSKENINKFAQVINNG
ncbi:flavodoxin domain-containing protein [Clostridium sp. CM028]|uniref:flavodoxin domain-containing protein n=1 Tax=unclassified Clostridium TaxID=2614128 RepID=UPI001C0BD6E8|nr:MULTISPECIES: flavodoxin domain-containing protein [unclassified Clostridium]MBU3093328.1 flavodoxin domain-containing protein [Clostridium sp. CF011]MBW9147267.1 flavodoxin domain-containing protein [Clostridium sp. CM027]MBW9150439.1 flavodoxin domain-containing protein [Clostridium sp. CM028]UVE41784.1 flavodoxin domain-containing protein [Clostridium sp. CM027]WAG70784.1 flavodoxin domain-containing protein [Clostridium sp. CF011]